MTTDTLKDTTLQQVDDYYLKMKQLQKELEFIELQEDYIKEEQKSLKRELSRAQEVSSSIFSPKINKRK